MPPDERTPLPRPRRLTLPPVGGERERRVSALEADVAVLQREERHQGKTIDEIKASYSKLAATVDTIDTTLSMLVGKVDQLLEKRKFWQKVQTGVLVGICLALFGFIAKISFIVQSAKLPTP